MKHYALLAISCILALGVIGCDKTPKGDASLTGEKVTVGDPRDSYTNLYILSEGLMGSNNASLDFFNPGSGLYVRNAFGQANPNFSLGDTANDVIAVGDELWIAVNGSDLIEVVDAITLVHKASIAVSSPRFMATDGKNVYVTSYNGAYSNYSDPTDYKNPKGAVFKINIASRTVTGLVEVGYQPEGVAITGKKLYVANSGGISSILPPNYSYDDTISEINPETLTITSTLTSVINVKELFIDSSGTIWIHTLGNYSDVHSGLYRMTPEGAERLTAGDSNLNVSIIWKDGDDFWIVGTEDEFDWNKPDKVYYTYKISGGIATKVNVQIGAASPYGIAVDPDTKDLFITDGPYGGSLGTIFCYGKADDYSLSWSCTSGVNPGHFLFL